MATKPEFTCPYDDKFCAHKEEAVREWERALNALAAQRVDHEFETSTDVFDGCLRGVQERARCARYRYYLERERQR